MTVVNCIVLLKELDFVPLVFGTIPRPTQTTPAPSQLEGIRQTKRVMDQGAKENSRRNAAYVKNVEDVWSVYRNLLSFQ